MELLFGVSVLGAKALITWTVETYYVAIALFQFIAILVGFKMMHADTENNLVIGSLVVAIAVGAVGFFVRDNGLIGVMITGSVLFGALLLISAGDALRSLMLTAVCIVIYAVGGYFLVPRMRTINAAQIGGFTNAFVNGLDEKPLAGEEDLYEHTKKSTDSTLK